MTLWELFVKISGDSSSLKRASQEGGDAVDTLGKRWESVDKRLAVSAGFAAIGAGAFAAAKKFEDAGVQIQRATGATGDRLASLEKSFASVYAHTGAASDVIAATMSTLSSRSQATGKDLENLTLSMLRLAKTQRESAESITPVVTRAFGDWSIAVDRQARALDYFRVSSQQSGTQVSRLAEQVVYAGAPLRQLGYGFDQAVSLIAKFEKEGVNTELVLGGMKAALQKFAKEGVTDTAQAWRDFVAGVRSGSITLQQVTAEVGVKRAIDLYKAIQEGRFQIEELVKSTEKLAANGGENVKTLTEKMKVWQHQVESVVVAHKDLIVAIGLLGTTGAWSKISAGFMWAAPATAGAISNIATAISSGLVPALTAMETALLGGGIAALLALIGYGGYKLGDAWSKQANPGGVKEWNPADKWKFDPASRSVVERTSGGSPISGSIIDFVSGKKNTSAPPPSPPDASGAGSGVSKDDKFKAYIPAASDAIQVLIDRQAQWNSVHKKTVEDIAKSGLSIDEYWAKQKQDAADSMDAFQRLADEGPPAIGKVADGVKVLTDIFDEATAAQVKMLAASPYGQLSEGMHSLGLSSSADLQKVADDAQKNYDIVRLSGVGTADDIERAWVAMSKAQIEADRASGRISLEEYAKRKKELDDWGKLETEHVRKVKTARQQMADATAQMFEGLERGLANSLVRWKGWGDAVKGVLQNFAADTISILEHQLFQKIEKRLVDLIGGVGGGVASGASGAARSASGVAGAASAGASGLLGAIGAIGSAVGAVSSVIGNFQMSGMNKSLDVLVNHTLRIFNELSYFRQDAWTREAHWYVRTADMWQSLLDIKDVLLRGGVGGGSSASGITFNNCTFNGTNQQATLQAAFAAASLAGAI